MSRLRLREYTVGVLILAAAGLAACSSPESGPAETAGQNLDQAAQAAGEVVGGAAEQVGRAISDTAITAKIKAAILAEPGLKVMQIDVETTNGVVMLTGTVDSRSDRDKAGLIAAGTDGVKDVENQLTVATTG
jgi:hyperosmotically inducible protein